MVRNREVWKHKWAHMAGYMFYEGLLIILLTNSGLTSGNSCGGTYNGVGGNITSPNYPSDYDNHHECEWTITVPDNHLVVIRFDDFELETQSSCSYDYLAIDLEGDGVDNQDIRFCGTGAYPLVSEGSTVNLEFDTDFSITERGFDIAWTAVANGIGS
ncbi:protein SpAN-like [Antedon mediterranea]|uniref:protein SpAN-like n=1 Tax=Antedon mediterranea TaxID=105859 RepID=UPI003AF52CFE